MDLLMAGPILKALCRLLIRERTTAGDHRAPRATTGFRATASTQGYTILYYTTKWLTRPAHRSTRWWGVCSQSPTGEHREQDAGDHKGPPSHSPPPSPLRMLMSFLLS